MEIRIRPGYVKRLLAGALFGLYMAHLLYYLNPQIDITPARLLLVTVTYSAICALLFGNILWLLRVARVRIFGRSETDYRQHGFGFVVFAAFVSAIVYWGHLVFFRIYLPPGAVRILSKATTLIAVTAFVLFILWLVERNASRAIGNAVLVSAFVIIAVSAFFLYQRRDRYHVDAREVVVANVPVGRLQPVLVVAIPDLPYDWVVTMIGEGSLPFFTQSQSKGFMTRMEPFPSTSSKALWASLVTGKLPHRHGVTGRFSYKTPLTGSTDRVLITPKWVGFRIWGLIPPVERISAQLPSGDSLPVWEMFRRVGSRAAVLNWPATTLANCAADVVLPEGFFESPSPSARPPQFASTARSAARASNLPDALTLRIDQPPARKIRIVATLRADTALEKLALHPAEEGELPFTLVTFDGINDTLSAIRRENNELPPRSTVEGETIRAVIEQIDELLGDLHRRLPAEATLIVVSPSAPVPPSLPATPIVAIQTLVATEEEGSDEGILVIDGPGAVAKSNPASARVVDLVPTVLFSSGIPVARDLDGKVLTEAFDDAWLGGRSISLIQTYEAKKIVVQHVGAP